MLYEPGRAATPTSARFPPACRSAPACSPPPCARPRSPRRPLPARRAGGRGAADARARSSSATPTRRAARGGATPAHARGQGRRGRASRRPRGRCARKPGVLSATRELRRARLGLGAAGPGQHARRPAAGRRCSGTSWPRRASTRPTRGSICRTSGRPGGKGVTVAVLDTGVAYANRGRFRRSPDFSKNRFVRGWDFVDDDPYPNDDNGHGTHVASTIAEGTGNTIGLTGLAYGVKLMPVKVLDRAGEGDSERIAARHPLRRRPRREDHQPLVRVPVGHHPRADPEHPGRDPLRPPQGLARRRRLRQRGRRRRRLPRPLQRRPVGRRDHPARLPGRLLQRGHRPRHRRPRRRRRRRPRRRSRLPPAEPAGAGHLPDDLHHTPGAAASASRTATSAPRWPPPTPPRPPRWWSPRASSAPNPTPDGDRAPPRDDGARPRARRPRPALRLGPARRCARDRPGDPGHLGRAPTWSG